MGNVINDFSLNSSVIFKFCILILFSVIPSSLKLKLKKIMNNNNESKCVDSSQCNSGETPVNGINSSNPQSTISGEEINTNKMTAFGKNSEPLTLTKLNELNDRKQLEL